MSELSVIIGKRIAQARTEQGLTQRQLAEYIGISVTYLSEIENGKRNLTAAVLIRIGRLLMVSLDWLVSESPVCCEDCGHPYGDSDWIDVTLPDDQWQLISGHADGGGILCAGCIAKRAARRGYIAGRLIFER